MKKLFLAELKKRILYRPEKNRSGVALIMAISALTLMTYLAMEIMYETSIEYIVNAQNLHRLKAYYAAKSGLEIGLLRVKIFQQLQPTLKNLGGTTPFGEVADLVWRLPFQWPIQVPDFVNSVDKGLIGKTEKESLMEAKYSVQIELEGTKIDVNDLWSPSKGLREITRRQLLNIFETKKRDDREFFQKHASFKFEELINSITDFMSDKRESLNGGNKKDAYREFQSPDFPPNRGFITLDEIRLVPGMTDEFFEILRPAITIYGMRAFNPNKAPPEVLKALDSSMTDRIVQKVIERRSDPKKGGPFRATEDPSSRDSFWSFLEDEGARLADETKKIPLVFDDYYNFRIVAVGEASKIRSTLIAITVDLKKQVQQVSQFVKKEAQSGDSSSAENSGGNPSQQPSPTSTQGQQSQNNSNAPTKGPPRIVYWEEL
jgi:general secretion pathway protein K